MPTLNLTDRSLKALAPKSRAEFWDETTPGFGVRVSEQGEKSFFVMYWLRGRRRRLTLGRYPALSLAQARRQAKAALGEVALGRDPAGERPEGKELRVDELVASYIAQYARVRKRSWAEDERILKHDFLPRWKAKKAAEISRADVRQVLESIVKRGAPVAANRARAVASRMFSWAQAHDLVPTNPCIGLVRPAEETPKERVLSEAEIAVLWWALEAEEWPVIRDSLRLLLLTGQRRNEVRLIATEQIRDDVWLIPGTLTKNKRAHAVPLSRQALTLLDPWRDAGEGPLLVSPRAAGLPLSDDAVTQAARRISKQLGFSFTPHDLRRTAATSMPSLGVMRFIVGRVLNHTDPSITDIYDLYTYLPEKREALQRWADHVERLVVAAGTSSGRLVPAEQPGRND